MSSTIWVAVTPLAGVVTGGALSLLPQRITGRPAARRHAASILESRRAERLSSLTAFMETAMEAERAAVSVYQHHARGHREQDTEEALGRLRASLRAVQLPCPPDVAGAARALAVRVSAIAGHGPGDGQPGSGQPASEILRPARMNLIRLARAGLERI